MTKPQQLEIWIVELDPVVGHEQAKKRPCLVVSDNRFNRSNADLVIIMPITSKNKKIPWHVGIIPPEGNLRTPSFVMSEQLRVVSLERFTGKVIGKINASSWEIIQTNIRLLFSLFV